MGKKQKALKKREMVMLAKIFEGLVREGIRIDIQAVAKGAK